MKFDSYSLKARFFPAIVISIPFSILIYSLFDSADLDIVSNYLFVNITTQLSLNLCVIYILAQLVRFVGKNVIELYYFKDELEFPTTKFLMLSNETLSDEYKSKIRKKAEADFNVNFPSMELEQSDAEKSKQRISEIVGLIRNKSRDSKLLLQHNIEYGFTRNLIGGCIIAIPITIMNIFVINDSTLFYLNNTLGIIFTILLISSKWILNRFAVLYAKRIYMDYLSI